MKHNRLTVLSSFPLFDQWYFTSLRQSRNDQGRFTFLVPRHQTPPEGSLHFLNSLFAARACAPKCEPACRLGYPSLLLFFLKINFVSLLSEQVLFKVLIWAVLRNIGWRLWKYSISPVQVIIIWHFSCSCWLFKTRVHIIMTKQNLWVIVKLTNLE